MYVFCFHGVNHEPGSSTSFSCFQGVKLHSFPLQEYLNNFSWFFNKTLKGLRGWAQHQMMACSVPDSTEAALDTEQWQSSPHLKCCVWSWAPQYKGDIKLSRGGQRWWCHSTKPDRLQEALGQDSQAHSVTLGDISIQQGLYRLDFMILRGHFQPRIFYE